MKSFGMRASLAVVTALCAGTSWAASPSMVPSSHREAPGVCETPKVDATDFYMFRSYEPGREDYVTIVANYIPFQTAYGGPNFFSMDPDALYQIHIDNNGDGKADLSFTFTFQTFNRDIAVDVGGKRISIPLYNVGGIGPNAGDNANLNIIENYTVGVFQRDQRPDKQNAAVTDASNGHYSFLKPSDSIGAKSQGVYEDYARKHIYNINLPGSNKKGRMFVGQRKDPFVANLGEFFDLVNTNPVGPVNGEANLLDDDNVTSIVLELPISYLARNNDPVIGGWTTASLRQTKVLKQNPTFNNTDEDFGPFVQVSRLGMPLVNEVVIGLRDKDRFNNSRPRDDAQFLAYVTNPSMPVIIQTLFGLTPPCLPRNDLVQIFLTGIPGLNSPKNVKASEMLRLNTSLPVTPKGSQKSLGVLAGDLAGFPNGRRPGDDVVDIELRALVGAVISDTSCAPSGKAPLTDGAFVDDSMFDGVFPYLKTPVVASPNTPK